MYKLLSCPVSCRTKGREGSVPTELGASQAALAAAEQKQWKADILVLQQLRMYHRYCGDRRG